MARRSSQAPGTRPSASGTRFPSARVAIRVAKADLTTVGSSDDTRDICDLVWWTFFASCHDRLFRLCSFSRLVDPCFALTIFHTPQRIFVLGTAISNVRQPSPSPPPTSHLYPPPTNLTHTTQTHIIQYTPRTRRYSFAFTNLSYCITDSSIVVSICVPFFVSRSFRSFFPNSFSTFPLLSLVSLLPLAFVHILICALPFSPALFYVFVIALRDSRHLEYRQSHYSERGMQTRVHLGPKSGRSDIQPYCFSV
jgi:hypothetical protein